jgi:hypothetical protein
MAFAERAQNNEVSFNNVWFSDEAHFNFDCEVNKQNVRFWASENTRVIHEKVHHAPRMTVWVAISSHGLLGLIVFEGTLSSERFKHVAQYFCSSRSCYRFAVTGSVVHAGLSQAAHSEMFFWTFCMTFSTRVSSQTDFVIVLHVDRPGPRMVLM